MAAEVNAVVSVIRLAGDVVSRIRDEVYKASDDTKSFPLKVKILEMKEAEMRNSLQRYSMSNDKFIKPMLDLAQQLLKSELKRSKKKRRMFWKRLIFPETLSTAIQNLTLVIESLPKQLEGNQLFRQVLESHISSEVAPLPFVKDAKYVPLATTVNKVREALENLNGGSVVTLYGGSGEGKTGLAKHLAAVYQDTARSRELERSEVAFPDGSFFLRCGPKADATSLLVELQQSLGFSIDGFGTRHAEDQGSTSNLPTQSLMTSRSQLQRRLKDQKILIVLDNVWETALVENLLIPAPGLKYLITSEIKDIWPDGHCTKIPIDKPTLEEARQILANHVRAFCETLPTQLESGAQACRWKLPAELEIVADQIIEKCGYNPLDIANVAISVDDRKALDPFQWEIAKKNLTDLVDGDPRRGPVLFSRSYSKGTMSNATELAIDSFYGDTKTILCIAGLCETEQLPEPLVKLFFTSVHSKLTTFLGCCSDLEGSSFIEREIEESSFNVTWSIHSKRRAVICEKLNDQIERIASKILEPPSTSSGRRSDETELLSALLFLYGRQSSQKRAIQNLDSSRNYAPIDGPSIARVRNCLEPFVFLLEADAHAQGPVEQEVHQYSKQIIIRFIKNGKLHDEAMSKLLLIAKSGISPAIFTALMHMALLIDEPLFTTTHHLTLKVMLGYLNRQCESGRVGFEYFVASYAMGILLLNSQRSPEISLMVIEEESTLPTLIKLLRTDNKLRIQGYTLASIAALSNSKYARSKIGLYPGIVEGLVESLLWEDDGATLNLLPIYGPAFAIARLTVDGTVAVCEKVASCPGALERLVRLLRSASADVQLSAVQALGSLCEHVREIRVTVGSCEGAVEGLVELLTSSDDPKIKSKAAFAIKELCYNVSDNAKKVGSCEGAIEGLVKLLVQSQGNPDSQRHAALAIEALCADSQENKSKIGSCPGAVEALVDLLAVDITETSVQLSAVVALNSLCRHAPTNQDIVGSYPGAMERIAELLFKEPNLSSPRWSSTMNGFEVDLVLELLATLCGREENCWRLALCCRGAFEWLVELTCTENPAYDLIQWRAGHVMENLIDIGNIRLIPRVEDSGEITMDAAIFGYEPIEVLSKVIA